MAIKLSTGKIKLELIFDNDEKEYIYFNPNDPDLYVRMTQFQENLENYLKNIEDVELDESGNPREVSAVEKYKNFREKLYEELDKAFDSKISHIVFKKCSPFAIIDGDYFIMQFVEGIIPEIQKHQEKATEDIKAKMAKHLDKYRK
jgi:uncharacterized protein YicC (UPF0701 family)